MTINELTTRGRLERVPADSRRALLMTAAEALPNADAVEQFDRTRRTRNRSEYGSAYFTRRAVEADLANARAIVEAVVAVLRRSP